MGGFPRCATRLSKASDLPSVDDEQRNKPPVLERSLTISARGSPLSQPTLMPFHLVCAFYGYEPDLSSGRMAVRYEEN